MKFSLPAGLLRTAIATAGHATPRNPQLIAYSGVLVQLSGTVCFAIGSSGEVTIAARVNVAKAASDGQALVPPGPVSRYLATLPADQEITASADDSSDFTISLPGRSSPYTFRQIPAAFPMPAASTGETADVDFTRLQAAVRSVRTAADASGVQLLSSGRELVLSTTDTYRLARVALPEAGFGQFCGQLSLAALDTITRQRIDKVTTDQDGRVLRLSGPDVVISTKLLATPFPDVSGIAPAPGAQVFTMERAALVQALEHLSAVATDITPLHCAVRNNDLVLSVDSTDVGSGSETIAISSGPQAELEFAVKLTFLSEAIASHDCQYLDLHFCGPNQALFFTSQEPFSTTTVVMPVSM